jgi:hypothetical protein
METRYKEEMDAVKCSFIIITALACCFLSVFKSLSDHYTNNTSHNLETNFQMNASLFIARKLFHHPDDNDNSNSSHSSSNHSKSNQPCPTEVNSGPAIVPIFGSTTFHSFATILSGACAIFSTLIVLAIIFLHNELLKSGATTTDHSHRTSGSFGSTLLLSHCLARGRWHLSFRESGFWLRHRSLSVLAVPR